MADYMYAMTLCVFLTLLGMKLASYLMGATKRASYPPGPKPKPVVGNMFDLPLNNLGVEYLEWGKKYNSNILFASALGNHVLVLNSREDADELFDKRATIYSDRPVIPILNVMGWEHNIAFLPYGEDWRYHRKICQQNFRPEAVKNYHPVLLRKVYQMLDGLLTTPEDLQKHNKMLSVSIPMSTMYGYDVNSIDDPCIAVADESNTLGGGLMVIGSNFINIFPVLGRLPPWIPGFSSGKRAAKVKALTEEMKRIPMDFVKKRVEEGNHVPSLVSNFLEKQKTSPSSKKEKEAIINIAYTVYGAASDTTSSSTGTFFYLMATHPEIQKKAQKEIDRIIGLNRLPNFEDRASLPYIEAIYREVMRWRPPMQAGGPHALSEDDYYKGYFIPKGTTVLGNIWAMTHNPAVYPDPTSFKPERFFDKNGGLNDDSRVLAYGFGRRVCVGKSISSSTIWLTMVSVLACFDIGKAKDEFGNEIEVNDEYDDRGFIGQKKPFKCSIKPRRDFSAISQLIADAKENIRA